MYKENRAVFPFCRKIWWQSPKTFQKVNYVTCSVVWKYRFGSENGRVVTIGKLPRTIIQITNDNSIYRKEGINNIWSNTGYAKLCNAIVHNVSVLNRCRQFYWWTILGRPGENHKPAASHSNFMLLRRVHFVLDMNRTHIIEGVMVFNATTFNNISVISWSSVLSVEKTGQSRWKPQIYRKSLKLYLGVYRVHFPLSGNRTHISLVIGTNCIGRCKSIYSKITASIPPSVLPPKNIYFPL